MELSIGFHYPTDPKDASLLHLVQGGGGVPQMLTFTDKGEGGYSIMIMHWGGGGRSHNDHLMTPMILFFGQELQKRANLYIL